MFPNNRGIDTKVSYDLRYIKRKIFSL